MRTAVADLSWCGAPRALKRQLHKLRGRDPGGTARYSVLNPVLVSELNLAHQWREENFDPWFKHDGWDPARLRARFLFDHNQLARDYRAMSRTIHGVEMRDPHGDRRPLEFLLAVPEPMYRRNGIPRSFARKVLADRLPPEIVNERRDGYQSATWFRRLNVRYQEISAEIERLEASPSANRMLDLPRLKRILEDWPKDENAAEARQRELRSAFSRGIYTGQFIRWVEGGNA